MFYSVLLKVKGYFYLKNIAMHIFHHGMTATTAGYYDYLELATYLSS